MLIYWFSSSFRMGDALPGPGIVPKEQFLQGLQPASRAVVPFSWCWLVCLFHVIKTTKMADTLEKALTFLTETNILHHYKGILLLKLLWQNQNYRRLGHWPRSLRTNLTDSHPNLVVNSVGAWLIGAWLTGAWLTGACLPGVWVTGAWLTDLCINATHPQCITFIVEKASNDSDSDSEIFIQPHIIVQSQFSHILGFNIMGQGDLH